MVQGELKLYRCRFGHFEKARKSGSCFFCGRRPRLGAAGQSALHQVKDKGLLAAWRLGGLIAVYELQAERDGILPDDMSEVRKNITIAADTSDWLKVNFPVKEVKPK